MRLQATAGGITDASAWAAHAASHTPAWATVVAILAAVLLALLGLALALVMLRTLRRDAAMTVGRGREAAVLEGQVQTTMGRPVGTPGGGPTSKGSSQRTLRANGERPVTQRG